VRSIPNEYTCPNLMIDDEPMLSLNKLKYLGNILTSDGNINSNMNERYKGCPGNNALF
jgi:hypothetical protein